MRIFEQFPQGSGHICPICGADTNDKTVLVPIHGTEDGHTMQAVPAHLNCILANIRYSEDLGLMGLEAKGAVEIDSEY